MWHPSWERYVGAQDDLQALANRQDPNLLLGLENMRHDPAAYEDMIGRRLPQIETEPEEPSKIPWWVKLKKWLLEPS